MNALSKPHRWSQTVQTEGASDGGLKSLNEAQTQSLLSVIAQYAAGSLSEAQAISVISASIGVDHDKARSILLGDAMPEVVK